jgi:hypothetical protein
MGKFRYSTLSPSPRPLIKLKMTVGRLAVLDLMQDYDILPATYIKASFESWHNTRVVLAECAKAHLIRVPEGYAHLNARKRVRPLELTDLGRKALADAGLLRQRERMNDHFNHAYFRSLIQFSFDRAAKEIPGMVFQTERDIIGHTNAPAFIKGEPNPSWFEANGHVIRSDAPIFGYQYRGAHIFLHGFEADRATERLTSDKYAKKTIHKMFAAYASYLERGLYQSRYGLPNITIPIITIGEQRMTNMLAVLKEVVPDPRIQRRFAFKALPNFLSDAPLPPPTAHMVTEPWTRVDGPFSILETLKATAERKANDRREEVGATA